jgi:hypothetical protein
MMLPMHLPILMNLSTTVPTFVDYDDLSAVETALNEDMEWTRDNQMAQSQQLKSSDITATLNDPTSA